VLAVVSIISLIFDDNWGIVWLVTGIASLVILGLPQVVELLNLWKESKQAKAQAAREGK
jgi:hypothetical protein